MLTCVTCARTQHCSPYRTWALAKVCQENRTHVDAGESLAHSAQPLRRCYTPLAPASVTLDVAIHRPSFPSSPQHWQSRFETHRRTACHTAEQLVTRAETPVSLSSCVTWSQDRMSFPAPILQPFITYDDQKSIIPTCWVSTSTTSAQNSQPLIR
jgi:hypothetical protein